MTSSVGDIAHHVIYVPNSHSSGALFQGQMIALEIFVQSTYDVVKFIISFLAEQIPPSSTNRVALKTLEQNTFAGDDSRR